MWGLLNETLNRNIRKQSTHEFSLNNKTTSDPEVIANNNNNNTLFQTIVHMDNKKNTMLNK